MLVHNKTLFLVILLIISFSATSQTLVGHWKMNEGSGSTLVDNSGNNNNAVLKNPKNVTWSTGVEGLAVILPGTTDRYATVANNSTLNITSAITIAAWIRPIDVSTRTILCKISPDGYELSLNKTNKVEFKFNTTSNGNTYRIISNANYPSNGTTWAHVAATFDGTTSKIYINGVLDKSASYSLTTIKVNTSALNIGSAAGSTRWKGALDEVRLYNGALSLAQVQQLAGVVPVPAAPLLIAPANAALNVPYNTTLSWNSVSTATKYRAEVSDVSNFTTTFFAQDNILTTSVDVSNLLPNKVYYWRVRASNGTGDGAWSQTWSFTTAPPPIPAVPTLSAPTDASVNIPLTPTLLWNTVPGATKYNIQISKDAAFSSIDYSQNDIASTSVLLPTLLVNTTYYWHVQAGNTSGNSAWSSAWGFTTIPPPPGQVLLNAPANAATNISTPATLSWNSLSGASSYKIEVSESASFATIFFTQANIGGTSIDVAGLLPNLTYYWRVVGSNAGGQGSWSDTWSFTTAVPQISKTLFHYWNFNNTTTTTTLIAPTLTLNNGSLNIQLAALAFIEAGTLNEFVGANARNGDVAGAHLRLNNPIGSVATFSISTAGYKDIVFIYETRRSTQGAERQKISYSLDGSTYTFLQNVSPFNGLPSVVTLDFTAITGANDNPNFKIQIEFEQGLGGTTGNNRFDDVTVEGTPLNVVVPPAQVVVVSPAEQQQEVPIRPTLTWADAFGAVTYDIQVATDDQFNSVVATKTVTGQLSYKLESALSAATNYFWRVRAVNTAGAGPWSSVRSFKTVLVVLVYQLAVNEVMSSNSSFITDEDGGFQDWLEIVNYGSTPINLLGFGLSDSNITPFKWVFPDKVIQPGEFLLIWASSKNRTDPTKPLHTNFAIGASGEEVLITAPDGELVDAMPPIAIPSDVSRGHRPDGTGPLYFFTSPTPGAANIGGVIEFLAKPTFSIPAGTYTTSQSVSLAHPDPTVIIRYTLDGSEPTTSSPQYSQPLQIVDKSGTPNVLSMIPTNFISSGSRAWEEPNGLVRKGTVVRAKAFKGVSESSIASTATYIIIPGRQYTLPVVSIVIPYDSMFGQTRGLYVPGVNYVAGLDNTGNYYQEGDAWERPASMEFFSPEFSFQQDIGLRINGGFTRRFPQKSLRVLARSEYGKSTIDHPMFKNYPYNSFKRLVLRNSGNDWGHTLFKDAVSHMLVSHIMPVQHYTPSIMFLNGEYWGIHNIRERADKFYVARIYNVDPDNIDYLSLNSEIQEGDDIDYKEMLNFVQNNDLAIPENFDGLKTRMDVENFTDYYAAEIYFANHDWPQGNIDYWRARVPYNPAAPAGQDGRWRWILYDVDLGFTDPNLNSVSRLLTQLNEEKNEEWPNFLLRKMVQNQEFKTNLINRIADELNTAFVPARINAIIDSITTLIEPEVPEHILRWSHPSSTSNWHEDVDVMKAFANARPAILRDHVRTSFALGNPIALTLNVSDKSHGSISLNSLVINSSTVGLANPAQPFPWQGTYFANVPIKLKALANMGYVFDHWLINGVSNSNLQITVTPTANTTIVAYFVNTSGITPVLTSPANNATSVSVAPANFTWADIPGTNAYRLEVSTTTDFINPVVDQTNITTANANVNGLLNGVLYYWRVMGTGNYGATNWSATWSFTSATLPPPGAVTLISPADAAIDVPIDVSLQWNAAVNTSYYTVQVSELSNFSTTIINNDNVVSTSLPMAGLLNNKTYYWRVRSNNVTGSSVWSATRSFKTIALVGKLLVGHWKMNEGGGATLVDQSGLNNDALLQNPKDITWVTGVEGLSLNMPGTLSRYGVAPHTESLNITDAITIAAWIRPIDISSRTILSKTTPDGYEFGINSSNKIEFRFNATTNSNTYRLMSAANFPSNGTTWMHVAATFDGTVSKIYINGVLNNTATYSAVTIKPNTSGLHIGSAAGSTRWKGGLDDVRLYHGALDASEIASLASVVSASAYDPAIPLEINQDLAVYPNPITNKIFIEMVEASEGPVSVTITDGAGRSYYVAQHEAANRIELNFGSDLRPGLYLMFVKTSTLSRVIKLIKE